MIKLETINQLFNLCGKMIRHDKTCGTHYIESISVAKYSHNHRHRYYISNKDGVFISGNEDFILVELLKWSVL